jgi:hypothetical protein
MGHTSHTVGKMVAVLSGLLLTASIYVAVMYYPLQQLCAFCTTRVH